MLGSVQAQTSYYHQTRTFVPVEFNIEGIATEYVLYSTATQLTSVVKGTNIVINSNNTYAIEKQAFAVGFETSVDAWNAATNYSGATLNHSGKVYNNVGWVRGIKSTNGAWGAYIWTLQNQIAFQSSTSSWWKNEDCIPVAISNVFVGSLGNYGPMSNVVDIGPVVDSAFVYPEAGQTNEATYQVDYTNVFYQLVIPDIWINPIEAYACVWSTNPIQFTVYGTNIPNGVTWTLYQTNFDGHAVLQTNVDWHYASVTPGNIATNYKIRATSVDNTNFYDEVNLYVFNVNLEIYKPKVIDPTEEMIPDSYKMATGSVTFVNLDNDDNDSKFDYNGSGTHDDIVTGGDNELVKVKLKLTPVTLNAGTVKLTATEGSSTIAVWTNNEKSVSYTLGNSLNVPSDFIVEGNSLVKTLWVEGISAHTTQRAAKLKMEYTTGATTCSNEVALTVVGIDQIVWKGKTNSVSDTSTLDADPNWPSGLTPNAVRVFPDARVVGGSVEANPRDKVGVEVTLTVEPPYEIKVYLKSFDVDDPSAATNVVDNETAEKDNRGNSPSQDGQFDGEVGGIKELSFQANVKTTNCDFQVTMQPGDNFRIVASGDKDFLGQLENNDNTQNSGATEAEKNVNKQRICSANVTGTVAEREIRLADHYASDTLTVWRFLHVEVDSMTAPPTTGAEKNTVDGNITTIAGNGTVAQTATLSVNLKTGLSPQDNSTNLTAGTGNGRFENGWVKIGSGSGTLGETQTTSLLGNGDDYVRKDGGIDIPAIVSKTGESDVDGKVIAWSGTTFTLNVLSGTLTTNYNDGALNVAGVSMTVSSVDTNNNVVTVSATQNIPFVLHDDDDDNILPGSVSVADLQESDNPAVNKMASVYIRPVSDGGGSLSNNQTNVVFALNTESSSVYNWGSRGNNAQRFWVAYYLAAFQDSFEFLVNDFDPNSEGGTWGSANNTPLNSGVLIYLESQRDGGLTTDWRSRVTVHELGHNFGLEHGPTISVEVDGIMHKYAPAGTASSNYFWRPADINIIRSVSNPN